ncbi:MAG: MBL fold metallo-hydrolase [Desulfosudaceae bacterium]
MIITRPGKIVPGLYALAAMEMPVFFLDGDRPALFDAGFACLATAYIQEIERTLADREPAFLFLTHSHFDHIGAVAPLKERYPGMDVCASPRVGALMERPSVIERIRMLSSAGEASAVEYVGDFPFDGRTFEPFTVDRALADGDEISVSDDLTVQVIATPGHTRDCLSYYIPEKKVLIASEAVGIPDNTGYVVTDFLVDYDTFMESMERLDGLDIDVLCFGHNYIYTGEDCRGFIAGAKQYARKFFQQVADSLDEEQGDVSRVIQRLRAMEYDKILEPKQPEPAYLMNLEARIMAVQKRLAQAGERFS